MLDDARSQTPFSETAYHSHYNAFFAWNDIKIKPNRRINTHTESLLFAIRDSFSSFHCSQFRAVWLYDVWHMLLQSINQVSMCATFDVMAEHFFVLFIESSCSGRMERTKINLVEWIERSESLFRIFVRAEFTPPLNQNTRHSSLTVDSRKYKLSPIDHIRFDDAEHGSFRMGNLFSGAHLKSVSYFGPSRINDGINLIRYMNQSRSYDIKHIPSNWRIKDATKKTCSKNAKRTFLLSGWLKKDKSRWPIINDAPASKSKSMAAHQFDRHPIAWSNINMLRIIYTQAP